MSNEIKNRQHAIGLFAPEPAPPFTTPIVSAVGFDSFTRNSPGNYTVGLHDAAPFATHAVYAGLGANVLGTIWGQIAPDGRSVLVTAFDAAGVPFDPLHFDLTVNTIRDGEGVGPAPALPGPPAPPAGGGLVGFSTIDADSMILRNGGMLTSVLPLGLGAYQLFLTPAADGDGSADDPNVSISIIPRHAGGVALAFRAVYVGPQPGAWEIIFRDMANAPVASKFSVQFFKG